MTVRVISACVMFLQTSTVRIRRRAAHEPRVRGVRPQGPPAPQAGHP